MGLCKQKLMSSEAAKERATTVYAWVPSKLLASKLPNMETCYSIECHNDDLKTDVFCGSDVRNLTLTQQSAFDLATVKWPSQRVTVKCPNARSTTNADKALLLSSSIGTASLVEVHFQLGPLLGCRQSPASLLVNLSSFSHVVTWPKVGDRQHDAHCILPKWKYVSNLDLDGTEVRRSFAASLLISSCCKWWQVQGQLKSTGTEQISSQVTF